MIKRLLNTKISKENKKGFTLAELLIVVAIIGVLVAISIPIFTSQLRKSRLSTNQANARAAYAAATAALLDSDATAAEGNFTYTVATSSVGAMSAYSALGTTTAIADWDVDTTVGSITLGNAVAETWQVAISKDGAASFTAS